MKAGIAGDGIMGQLLAFSLVNVGWDVTLYGSGVKNNCSNVAAGLLAPIVELEKNDSLIFQLGIDALTKHWPSILEKLPQTIYFRQLGSLILSHPKDEAELKRVIGILSRKLPNSTYYQSVTSNEISALEPEIKNFNRGYYIPHEAQIDNQSLLVKMKNYLKKRIKWITRSFVSDIRPGKIRVADKVNYFDFVFDCRGLEAKTIFPDLRGVRGELIWLHAPDISISRPIHYLHPRYSLYIAPRPQHIYIIGSSEIETENYNPISVRTTLELLTAIYSVQPKFIEAQIIKTATQCRPTLPDCLAKIKYTDKFFAINGLYRHGYLIAPTLAADIIQGLQYGISKVCYPQLFEKIEVN